VTGIRIIAVLAAIAVMAILEYGLATPWYIALPVGILTYLLARYVGWAIGERRRIQARAGRNGRKGKAATVLKSRDLNQVGAQNKKPQSGSYQLI
jgi:hypothetical protein